MDARGIIDVFLRGLPAGGRAVLLASAQAVLLVGCSGGMHHRGEQQVSLVGSYDHPIKGRVGWPAGDGRAANAGVTASYHYFFADRWAVAANLTPYRGYAQDDGTITAGEYSMGVRYFITEFDMFDRPFGVFADLQGGMLYAARSVPEGGSNVNFTQETGIGFEYRITPRISWVGGYRLRHMSNAYLFDDQNPSQNDQQIFTGIAISFP